MTNVIVSLQNMQLCITLRNEMKVRRSKRPPSPPHSSPIKRALTPKSPISIPVLTNASSTESVHSTSENESTSIPPNCESKVRIPHHWRNRLLLLVFLSLVAPYSILLIHNWTRTPLHVEPPSCSSSSWDINLGGFSLHCSRKEKWRYVWFQHVRKAGGSSICTMLKYNGLQKDNNLNCQLFPYLDDTEISTDIIGLKGKADRWHTQTIGIEKESFRVIEYMNHYHHFCDVLMLTVIRNPIDRAWSDLNYDGTWTCKEGQDMMECAAKNQFWISNFYVRVFSGLMARGYKEFGDRGNATLEMVTEFHFKLSLLILQQFDVVIILEEWDTHTHQLRHHGIYNTTLPRQNVNHKKSKAPMTSEMKQYLTATNGFDMRFFEAAREIARQKSICSN